MACNTYIVCERKDKRKKEILMKNWKKYLAASLAVAAISTAQVSVSEAAYELSSEVKTATPALLNAAQIGVMVNENAALALSQTRMLSSL